MRDDHLKGWLAEVRKKEKEEVAADKTTSEEVTTAVTNGMGG